MPFLFEIVHRKNMCRVKMLAKTNVMKYVNFTIPFSKNDIVRRRIRLGLDGPVKKHKITLWPMWYRIGEKKKKNNRSTYLWMLFNDSETARYKKLRLNAMETNTVVRNCRKPTEGTRIITKREYYDNVRTPRKYFIVNIIGTWI